MDPKDRVPPNEGMKEQLTSNIMRLVARRRQEDAKASLSERVAERITTVAGSMAFVIMHVVFYGGALMILTDPGSL